MKSVRRDSMRRSHMGVITLKGDVKVCGFNKKYVCWGNG